MPKPSDLGACLAEIIRSTAAELDSVAIPSFGTFIARKRDEEIVDDLSSGRRMLLPPQITLEFVPAAKLRKNLSQHE
ncbi:MAG: HU family DNA-binding protein [Bacteroides sp.]|nr:HU family DNA-binding protein [Bacteroides sp.]MCM1094686.1 HU family DNA-binding protein [Terasakiella sp.]